LGLESSDSPGDQQSPVFEDLLSDSRYLPDRLYEQKEREQIIRQQVDLLPENQRLSLVLVTYQELSYQEVSQIIGCSVSAVKSLIHRARQKLKQKLIEIGIEESSNAKIRVR
jgi:RNA polymerase sigma-70 factor (ECF subfamily)